MSQYIVCCTYNQAKLKVPHRCFLNFVDVLIRMDIVDPVLDGREGGPDLKIRLIKTGSIAAVVPVFVSFFVQPVDGKYKQYMLFSHDCFIPIKNYTQ